MVISTSTGGLELEHHHPRAHMPRFQKVIVSGVLQYASPFGSSQYYYPGLKSDMTWLHSKEQTYRGGGSS